MPRDYDQNRENVLKFALQNVLMPLIHDYLERRSAGLVQADAIEAELVSPRLSVSAETTAPLSSKEPLSLDGVATALPSKSSDLPTELPEGYTLPKDPAKILAEATAIRALDQSTLNGKQRSILKRAALIELYNAQQASATTSTASAQLPAEETHEDAEGEIVTAPPKPVSHSSTASDEGNLSGSAVTTASVDGSQELALATTAQSTWPSFMYARARSIAASFKDRVDSPALTRDKMNEARHFLQEVETLLAAPFSSFNESSATNRITALQRLVKKTQDNLSKIRHTHRMDFSGQLEIILEIYAQTIRWLQEDNVLQTLPLVLACEDRLTKLPADAVAQSTYDAISYKFISDMFRVALVIRADSLSTRKEGYTRLLPDTQGEVILPRLLDCITDWNEFNTLSKDPTQRSRQLKLLMEGVAKVINDEQATLEGQRLLPTSMAWALSSVLPVTPRNAFLDETAELLAQHIAKADTLPKPRAQSSAVLQVA